MKKILVTVNVALPGESAKTEIVGLYEAHDPDSFDLLVKNETRALKKLRVLAGERASKLRSRLCAALEQKGYAKNEEISILFVPWV